MPDVAKTFVADIQANQEVSGHFVVADKQLRLARNGTPFLTLKLVDRTGEISGRIWERAAEMDATVAVKAVIGQLVKPSRNLVWHLLSQSSKGRQL